MTCKSRLPLATLDLVSLILVQLGVYLYLALLTQMFATVNVHNDGIDNATTARKEPISTNTNPGEPQLSKSKPLFLHVCYKALRTNEC